MSRKHVNFYAFNMYKNIGSMRLKWLYSLDFHNNIIYIFSFLIWYCLFYIFASSSSYVWLLNVGISQSSAVACLLFHLTLYLNDFIHSHRIKILPICQQFINILFPQHSSEFRYNCHSYIATCQCKFNGSNIDLWTLIFCPSSTSSEKLISIQSPPNQ